MLFRNIMQEFNSEKCDTLNKIIFQMMGKYRYNIQNTIEKVLTTILT